MSYNGFIDKQTMYISEYGVTLEPEELRGIIRGEIGFRKCPDCQGYGESWTLHYVEADDKNEVEQFRDVSDEFAANFSVDDHPELTYGECFLYKCDTCKGVGYLPVEQF